MPNFFKFLIFVCFIVMLPVILNIIDNVAKIINIVNFKNSVLKNLCKFNEKEFLDFALEFLNRTYGFINESKEDCVYLCNGKTSRFLYYNNDDCDKFDILDARKLIAFFESKGVKQVFIFTTKIFTDDVIKYFESLKIDYDIKYIHGNDLDLNYRELVSKYYGSQKYV